MDGRDKILYLDIWRNHDWDKTYQIIKEKDVSLFEDTNTLLEIETELYSILAKGYKIVVLIDAEYPKEIRDSMKPPFVIYYKGDLNTVSERYSYTLPGENPKRMFIE